MVIESVWGWRMLWMRAVLETRRKAAAVRVEELEAELERLRAALTNLRRFSGFGRSALSGIWKRSPRRNSRPGRSSARRRASRWGRAVRCRIVRTRPGPMICPSTARQ